MRKSSLFILSVLGIALGLTSVAPAGDLPPPEVFQATLRGVETSGAVIFSASPSGQSSGDVVIFHQGELFLGHSESRVQESKLVLTFSAVAKSDKSRVRQISGSLEAPFSGETPPQKLTARGIIAASTADGQALKIVATQAIKATVVRTPQISTRYSDSEGSKSSD